jgi:hypothetical protein
MGGCNKDAMRSGCSFGWRATVELYASFNSVEEVLYASTWN